MGKQSFSDLFEQSPAWERKIGYDYYDALRRRLYLLSVGRCSAELATACFCILSPTNSEKINFIALAKCMDIADGVLPVETKVPAYGTNTTKALSLLRFEKSIEQVLSGRKVTSFYQNILNPDDQRYVTVDGHMFNLWRGEVSPLQRTTEMNRATYEEISKDLCQVAASFQWSAPRFQAVLWLAWKRVNGILYHPQMKLQFEEESLEYRASYQ